MEWTVGLDLYVSIELFDGVGGGLSILREGTKEGGEEDRSIVGCG